MLKPVEWTRTRTTPDGMADGMIGVPVEVGMPGGLALAPGGSRGLRPWRLPALLVGAALACLAALALAMLPVDPAPSSRALSARHGLRSHPPTRLPVSLAAAASASIGASAHRYWPVHRGASLLTQGGGIHGTFTAAGAALRGDKGTLGLSLAAVGRGRHLERVATAEPQPAANQILYRHGSISELYRNGPYGLEQGFRLGARPRPGAGPLVLALGLRGSLSPEQTGSQILFRTPSGATALRYGQLRALDATGRRLPAHIQLVNGTLQLQIDDTRARYPIRIDPFIQQGEKLTGSGETGAGIFGVSVALSGDGKTALIGAENDNEDAGAAWVFTRSGSTWTQQGSKLTGGGEVGKGFFGASVALSSEGNTALIGGESDNKNVGAAWVFTRNSESKWTQQGEKLTGSGEKGEGEFGIGVALSSAGNTALVGGYGDNKRAGAAWVFTRASEKWTQSAELTGTGATGAEVEFGVTAALSGDGKTALIGGRGDNGNIGAVWVFTESGSTWTQQAKLTGSGETGNGQFGESVALSREGGNTALIGAQADNGGTGAAWVFTRASEKWTQQGEKLTGGGETGSGQFGSGVALSGDGNTALIGGMGDNSGIGAAWVFTRASEKWTQQGEKLTAGGESGSGGFGSSVALSTDKNTALIGGSADNGSTGAAWVFTTAPIVVTGTASSVAHTSATLNATVNPNGVEVKAGECKFEYGTTTAYGLSAPCTPSPGSGESPVAVSASVTGLSEKTTYHFRISATNASGTSLGSDQTFGAPTVVTGAASAVTKTSATLHATVNPNNVEVSECKFEYGTNTKYESAPVSCSALPGSGSSPVEVSASVTGLSPNTPYHFRISATNAGGTNQGADQELKTVPNAPTVGTCEVSGITQTAATLCATVNPNGGEVSECKFEYGTTTEYGSSVPCTPPHPSGVSPVTVSASVTGLTANTVYHFRVSATNAGGTEKGSDREFKTLPKAPTFEACAGLSMTQTTATLCDKVNPNGGQVSECKFEWGTNTEYKSVPVSCSPLPGSGESFEPVFAQITGLTPNTIYHFRISARNPGGLSNGPDQEVKTLPERPVVELKPPSSITRSSATLNATVNPKGGEVKAGECNFEYGPTTAYESSAPCTPLPLSGSSPVAVSASVTGLAPNTTYHVRISATNAGGTSRSEPDQTFATLLPNPPTFATSFTAPSNLEGSFKEPDAVALDTSGNIWVGDSGHNRVLEFNKERKFLRQFGTEGSGEGQFKGIGGIAANSAGDVYVTDSRNDRVQEFSPTGGFLRQWGSPGSGNGGFLDPTGIAVDSSGNVWVLDTFNYRVQEFSESGAFLKTFGSKGTENGQLGWASGLAFSGGNLYVADSARVEEFSTAGAFVATFGSTGTGNGQFHGLGGIATDPTTGDLYVSDTFNNRVQKFTAAGVFLSAVGSGGSGNGQFSAPTGVAVNSSGTVYVADTGNNRVQEWLAGEPPTFANSFTPEKVEGGFKEPDAVAVDPSGNIWVADSGHNRVLEFNSKREFLRQVGVEAAEGQFKGIQGIATNSAGDVYVSGSDRVQEFSPAGALLRQFGSPGSGNGQFLDPTGIAVDSSGNVWVLDTFNFRVQEFSATGTYLGQFGSKGTENGQLGWASGLAFAGGNLYVADSSRVEEFSTAGAYLGQFGSTGTGNGQFHGLGGIATDPSTGNLYVSDVYNNRVQEFSSSGAFIGFIAAFGSGGSGNGQFSGPRGVAVSSSGTVYVADTGNNRVQEWIPSP